MSTRIRRRRFTGACWWLLLLFPLAGTASAATILVFGDSISAAYGLKPEQGWVALLQQRLDAEAAGRHHVINGSVSGETTSGGLRRLKPLLEQHHPDVVVLELGGNDGLRGQPPETIAANLGHLIDDARAAGAKVVMLGIRIPPNYGRPYAQAFDGVFGRVSARKRVPLVPFFLADRSGGIVPLQDDGIHPTAAAQPQLLDNAWRAIHQTLRSR